MTRTRDTIDAIVQALDVRNSFAFLPHRRAFSPGTLPKPAAIAGEWEISDPLTMCNAYASVFCACLGVRLPPTMKANQMVPWLKGNEGAMAGWMVVDSETARQRALSGFPTVVGWVNPTGASGHIAMVVPSPHGLEAELFVSAAGKTNFSRARLRDSFGDVAPLVFATHD